MAEPQVFHYQAFQWGSFVWSKQESQKKVELGKGSWGLGRELIQHLLCVYNWPKQIKKKPVQTETVEKLIPLVDWKTFEGHIAEDMNPRRDKELQLVLQSTIHRLSFN